MKASSVVVGGTVALGRGVVGRVVEHVLKSEGAAAEMSITFLGWRQMRRLNSEQLGHDCPTDVISFSLPQPDGSLSGDVYLCRPQAVQEAHDRKIPARTELVRLLVHATLHVLGWDHPDHGDREACQMWKVQEKYVAELM